MDMLGGAMSMDAMFPHRARDDSATVADPPRFHGSTIVGECWKEKPWNTVGTPSFSNTARATTPSGGWTTASGRQRAASRTVSSVMASASCWKKCGRGVSTGGASGRVDREASRAEACNAAKSVPGATSTTGSPASAISRTADDAVANSTRCPAAAAACARGTSGNTMPRSGGTANIRRIGSSGAGLPAPVRRP